MNGIYISYRRTESAAYAGRLFDHLSQHFGPSSVFMDIQGGITRGQEFPRAIESALNACNAALVIIGYNWATCTGKDGQRRLDDPNDWVRIETAAALRRNVLVIPVLVDGASLPDPANLPEEIRPLCQRHACELTDSRWSYDVGELVRDLEKAVRPPKRSEFPRLKGNRLRLFAGGTITLALLLGMALVWLIAFHRNRPELVTTTPNSIQTSLLPKPVPQTSAGSEVQAGHLAYKLLKTNLKQYSVDADGKPSKWALQCSIRVTDVMGLSSHVDGDNFRLLVDGLELLPQNHISQGIDVRETVDVDALFTIPADADRVELIVGRSNDATAKIQIRP